jgi:hypothetical protein
MLSTEGKIKDLTQRRNVRRTGQTAFASANCVWLLRKDKAARQRQCTPLNTLMAVYDTLKHAEAFARHADADSGNLPIKMPQSAGRRVRFSDVAAGTDSGRLKPDEE